MMSFLRVLAIVLVVLNMASGFHIHGLALRQLVGGRGQRTAATTSRRQRATESHGMAEDRAKEIRQELRQDGTSCRSLTRGDAVRSVAAAAATAVVVVAPHQASARKPGVNRPDLLPKEATNVIDLVGMLTKGQTKRINKQLGDLEEATGYRLRLLCQKYPETPGLAVKDYWKVDDKTIVMVVDPGEDNSRTGGVNILNFNVGDGLRLSLPPQFWQRLQNRYGNRFYVRDNGQDGAIISAVDSINLCLRSESGFCVDPPDIVKAANDQAVLQSIGKGGR